MIFNQTCGGGSPELQTKTVAPSTSQQLIVPDTGFDGLSQVTVTPALLETKSVTPSTNQQVITPGSGYYGMGRVTVGGAPLQSRTVTPSGSYQTITPASGYYGLSRVGVNAINLQTKTVYPSQFIQVVTPDSGYQGLSSVTVGPVSNADGYALKATGYVTSSNNLEIEIPNLNMSSNWKISSINMYILLEDAYSGSNTFIEELYIAKQPNGSKCNSLYYTTDGGNPDGDTFYMNESGEYMNSLTLTSNAVSMFVLVHLVNVGFWISGNYTISGFISVASVS